MDPWREMVHFVIFLLPLSPDITRPPHETASRINQDQLCGRETVWGGKFVWSWVHLYASHAAPYWFLYWAIKRSRYNTKHLQKWLSQNGTIFNGTGGKHYSHNASQVMCTAILTSWDSRELTIIRLMCGISSSLSLVGCIFIITAYILRPELHKKLGLQLILTLSIAGIVDAFFVF